MRQIPRRASWALALMTAIFIPAVSAFGQSGQSIQQQASQAATAQAGAVGKRLSVDEAVALALEQNLNLQVQRLDPQLQDLSILQVKTAWTPWSPARSATAAPRARSAASWPAPWTA